jgi:AhpD family alkylhydroperoxidase
MTERFLEATMQALTLEPRMTNPVYVLPDALPPLIAAHKAALRSGIPAEIVYLVHLRASQINGCSHCTQLHAGELKHAGTADEKIWAVGAWRESPLFSPAERAALALAESVTRLADRPDPVPDDVFDEAARHFSSERLSGLILEIALINVWNRINVTVRQPAEQAG